ncbi:MAG: GTPase ObgE [FCB group bacterium]|nr:GTPase ObgE [FCB group bacterium]
MFVDYVTIDVKSGRGGDGLISFRREKFIAKGGPNGGDGGRGGNVVVLGDENMHTLLDYRYQRHYKAEAGKPGGGSLKTGRGGEDVVLKIPVGTVVKNLETGEVLADMDEHGKTEIIAAGGKGGLGNDHFKSPTNQTPRKATPGKAGIQIKLTLELKLLADVGLVGYPNAGKSTLLSRVTAAKPKIADYPFTTLVPNLGIVKLQDYRTLVMADIPGIIEGASEGKGLGHQFLRHIQRSAVLLVMIDGFASDIDKTYQQLYLELEKYDPELVRRKMIKVINKTDIIAKSDLEDLKRKHGDYKFISAVTGEGVDELLNHVARAEEKDDDSF